MALLPLALRPTVIVRGLAMRRGLLGSSTVWKVVAIVVFGRGTLQKLFGRQPEFLGRRRIGIGHSISVAVLPPTTRRQRKRSGVTKASLAAAARADLEGAQRAS